MNPARLNKIGVKRVLEVGGVKSILVTDKCRNPFNPNDGFLRQLAQLEDDIKKSQDKMCSQLEVCPIKKPLYAPNIHYRDPKSYCLSTIGFNRQKVAQHLYFNCEDAAVNPVTHTEKGSVKAIIFKAL